MFSVPSTAQLLSDVKTVSDPPRFPCSCAAPGLQEISTWRETCADLQEVIESREREITALKKAHADLMAQVTSRKNRLLYFRAF